MTSDPMQTVHMKFFLLHIPSPIQHAYLRTSKRNLCLSQLHGRGCTQSVQAKRCRKEIQQMTITEFHCFEIAPWNAASLSASRRLKGFLLDQGSP